MPDLHRIRRHIERHVINHDSMVKRISYSKKNARLSSRSDIVLDSSLSLLLPRNQEKKRKRKKKEKEKSRDDVLLISFFMLFRIDGDIFLQARDTSSSPLKYRDEGGRGVSWSVGKEIGARHFLLEPRARIRSVYRMQIDRLGRSGGRESGSSPSGRTTERRS